MRLVSLKKLYWDRVLVPDPANSLGSIAISVFIACLSMGSVWAVQKMTGIYMTSIFILALVLIGLLISPLLTTVFGFVLSLFGDYFYLPPLGSVLDSPKGWEHMIILTGIATIVSSLTRALRKSTIEQIEMEASKRSVAEAVKLVSHDLRNPLSGIKMRAQLIRTQIGMPEKQIELATKIEQSCNRMDSMIQSIIESSRQQAGVPIELKMCDLVAIVREAIDDSFLESRNRIEFVCENSTILGLWGKEPLKRALENLIGNAIKYGRPAELVRVKLEKSSSDNVIRLSVHNFGNEISATEQEAIFSSFVRGKSSKNTVGWGLGLATVKAVSEAHGGGVSVQSGQGTGTEFTITLPLRHQTDSASPSALA